MSHLTRVFLLHAVLLATVQMSLALAQSPATDPSSTSPAPWSPSVVPQPVVEHVASIERPAPPSIVASFTADTVTGTVAFVERHGGEPWYNPLERDVWRNMAIERLYDRDSVAAGATIAAGLVVEAGDLARLGDGPLELVIAGHIREGERTWPGSDAAVLLVDLMPGRGDGSRSSTPCTTLTIRFGDLARIAPNESFDRIQQVPRRLDERACECAGLRGTSADEMSPHVIGVRVRYTGAGSIILDRLELRAVPAETE